MMSKTLGYKKPVSPPSQGGLGGRIFIEIFNSKFINLLILLVITFLTNLTSYSQSLTWPEVNSETKPWARWWWMGSAVDSANLTYNMELYQKAGIGGLEITPIYGVKGFENKFIDFLSPHWMEMF